MSDSFINSLLDSESNQSVQYGDSGPRFQTQLPLALSWPSVSGQTDPNVLFNDDPANYLMYPAGVHQTAMYIQTKDRYSGVTVTVLSGSLSVYLQVSEYFSDLNPAFISAPYTISGEAGENNLLLASYLPDTPEHPEDYWISLPGPGTYKIAFPEPVIGNAMILTHSGSASYALSQVLPRKSVQSYDLEVNSIKAYHISSTLIDTIALQVSDSIVVGPDLIGAKSIDGSKIVDGTISGVLIQNGTVTGNKILAGTISGVLITAGTISATQIATSGITAVNLAANSITADKISTRVITADKIVLSGITAELLGAEAVTAAALASGAVISGKIAANSIYASNIVGGQITGYHVAANTITGDNIQANSIGAGQIAASAIYASNIVGGAIKGYHVEAATISGSLITSGTITASNIAGGTITFDKLASKTLTADQIADSTITGQNILAGTVSGVLITNNTITGSNILARTISGELITAGSIKGENIQALTISGALITAGTITAENIAVSGITADRIKVTQLDTLTANMGTLTVNSGITIGTNGTIWAGAGSVSAPTTGLKIYTTSGVSRLTTFNGGVAQINIDTTGKLTAGAGAVILDSAGMTAGKTLVDSSGVTVGKIGEALASADALKIVSSGSVGSNGGIAFYNGAYSSTSPQASIITDSTSNFGLSNNAPNGTTIIGMAETGNNSVNIYNANINIEPTVLPTQPNFTYPGSIYGYARNWTGNEILRYYLGYDQIKLNNGSADTFNVTSAGALTAVGDIKFGASSNKLTVAAATGNTAVAGTLDVTGKFSANDLAYITLTRTATLSITTAGTTITWTSRTRYNNITYSTTDVTVGNSGYYLVAGTFATVANVSLTMTVARGTVNYTSNLQSTPLSTGNGYIFNFAQVLYLAANSVIKVILTPSANTTLNVNAEGFAGPSPILNIVQLAGI